MNVDCLIDVKAAADSAPVHSIKKAYALSRATAIGPKLAPDPRQGPGAVTEGGEAVAVLHDGRQTTKLRKTRKRFLETPFKGKFTIN